MDRLNIRSTGVTRHRPTTFMKQTLLGDNYYDDDDDDDDDITNTST